MKFIIINGPKPRGSLIARSQALISGRNNSILPDKTQHLNIRSNFFISVLIADVADDREAEQLDGAVAESYLLTDIVSAMGKGPVEAR